MPKYLKQGDRRLRESERRKVTHYSTFEGN